jgi:cytochrome c-type biogenesis protein CcmH
MKNSRLIKHYLLASCVVFLVILFPAKAVWGQDVTPSDDEVNQIAQQLYCPVCENVPLDECMTEACQQWRDLIRQQLADGWTEEEIKDYFVAQYGDKVLGEPPRQGLNWVLYLFPPLLILIAALFLLKKFKSPQRKSPGFTEDDPYLLQVERDLEDSD